MRRGGTAVQRPAVPINQAYALKGVAKAHIDLESRKTTGASILKP